MTWLLVILYTRTFTLDIGNALSAMNVCTCKYPVAIISPPTLRYVHTGKVRGGNA